MALRRGLLAVAHCGRQPGWLFPVLQGLGAIPPPWSSELQIKHPFFNWSVEKPLGGRFVPLLIGVHGIVLPIAFAALVKIGRRSSRITAVGIGLVVGITLLLFLFGSFWSVTRILQPVRFSTMFWNLLAVLAGVAIVAVRERFCLPSRASAALLVLVATVLGGVFVQRHPKVKNDQDAIAIMQFVERRTGKRDRILMQASGFNHILGQAAPRRLGASSSATRFPMHGTPFSFIPTACLTERWSRGRPTSCVPR